MAIACYLTAYQMGITSTVWDPLFDGSPAVLGSSLSRSIPIPDALLGAGAYALEAVLDLAGDERRWHARPWLVVAFGLVSAGLAMAAIGLVLTQALVVRAFCSLCLASAAISLTIGALAWEEISATLTHLRRAQKQPKETPMTAFQPVQSADCRTAGGRLARTGPIDRATRPPGRSRRHRRRSGSWAGHRSRVRQAWVRRRPDRPQRRAARQCPPRSRVVWPSLHGLRHRRLRRRRGGTGCREDRGRTRSDRRVGERRDGLGLLAHQRDDRGRVQAGHRGQLSRLCLRHAGGTAADAASRQGRGDPCRLRPGLPLDPPSGCLLRDKARHPGLPRIIAYRADSRR